MFKIVLNMQVSNATLSSFEEWFIVFRGLFFLLLFLVSSLISIGFLGNRHFHVQSIIAKVCVLPYLYMKMKCPNSAPLQDMKHKKYMTLDLTF